MAFIIKRNDTRPPYIATMKEKIGEPDESNLDLTDADHVNFIMKAPEALETKVNSLADIEDAATGLVSYTWETGDTDTSGTYQVEFEIHWADGGVQTVPNNSYGEVEIIDDLDDDGE